MGRTRAGPLGVGFLCLTSVASGRDFTNLGHKAPHVTCIGAGRRLIQMAVPALLKEQTHAKQLQGPWCLVHHPAAVCALVGNNAAPLPPTRVTVAAQRKPPDIEPAGPRLRDIGRYE
jgi:hypothetical protein